MGALFSGVLVRLFCVFSLYYTEKIDMLSLHHVVTTSRVGLGATVPTLVAAIINIHVS